MGYTIYKQMRSDNTEAVDGLYQGILKLITIEDGRNLFDIFKSDYEVEGEANKYFHEYGMDMDNNPVIAKTDDRRGFCKTARKLYDIAILLGYAFDEYLVLGNKISGDYSSESDRHVQLIMDSMENGSVEGLKTGLWRYINNELDRNDYKEGDVDRICDLVIQYCNDNDVEEEEERDYEYEKEQDKGEIVDKISEGYTSGITGYGNSWSLSYEQDRG